MAVKKANKEEKKEVRKFEYKPAEIGVSKVREIKGKDDCYRFNLEINGVSIYGCSYITYTNKEGKEDNFIAFPQYKGSDGNYYNTCWFPINDPAYRKEFEEIENQISKLIES